MESQPSPGPRGDPKQAIIIQHVGTEEEATQHLGSPGRPPRGGDIINKMNGIGQAAVGRGEEEHSWAGKEQMQRHGSVCKVLAPCPPPGKCFINVRHYRCGILDLSL